MAALTIPDNRAARFVAIGFGAGAAPFAPGTFGSLAGLAMGALAIAAWYPALPLLAIAATLAGLWAVGQLEERGSDPGWIVIDEIAGQLIAMLPMRHLSVWSLIAAFLLFRLFDITKLGPVGWADRKHGAFGVMLDDVIAGAIAASVLAAAMLAVGMLVGGTVALP